MIFDKSYFKQSLKNIYRFPVDLFRSLSYFFDYKRLIQTNSHQIKIWKVLITYLKRQQTTLSVIFLLVHYVQLVTKMQ